MLARISHSWCLRRLRRKKQRITRAYDADVTAAYRTKKFSDVPSIRETQHWEIRNYDIEIDELETAYYLGLADIIGIALPPRDEDENGDGDNWYRPEMYGHSLLTRQGRAKLRSDIRKEKRERREGWLPYISALTGLLGVVVAALALVYKR